MRTASELVLYRDHGPLATAIGSRVTARRGKRAGLSWLIPPFLRALEYGTFIALTLTFAPDALPACFALLSALAFHHYDSVYRLRHQRIAPPQWVRFAGGGWELRLLIGCVLAVLGVLGPGMLIAAIALGAFHVTESVASWRRFTQPAAMYETEEDEQE
ncbi:MAG: DUF5941 domain-containing protein [Pseudonocardiaceae bacterium]